MRKGASQYGFVALMACSPSRTIVDARLNQKSSLPVDGSIALCGLRETGVRDLPCGAISGAHDDANPDAGIQPVLLRLRFVLAHRLGVFDRGGSQPLGCTRPASEEPEISRPGNNSAESGGVIFKLFTR